MKNIAQFITESSNYKPEHRLDNNKMNDLWEQAYAALGGEGKAEDNKMLNAIQQMLDTDTCTWILEALNTDYDLGLFDEED